MKKIIGAALAASSLAFSSFSLSAIVDFEGYVHGEIVDDPLVTSEVSIAVSALNIGGGPDLAVVFDTSLSDTLDPDLEGPFSSQNPELGDLNPGNVLILQENSVGCGDGVCDEPDDEGTRNAGSISFDFSLPVTIISLDFFDIETVETTSANAIQFFDENDQEILPGMFYTPDTGGDNFWDQLTFNVDNVARMTINLRGSGAIDNLVYEVETSEVPLPGALMLFMSSLLFFMKNGHSASKSRLSS